MTVTGPIEEDGTWWTCPTGRPYSDGTAATLVAFCQWLGDQELVSEHRAHAVRPGRTAGAGPFTGCRAYCGQPRDAASGSGCADPWVRPAGRCRLSSGWDMNCRRPITGATGRGQTG